MVCGARASDGSSSASPNPGAATNLVGSCARVHTDGASVLRVSVCGATARGGAVRLTTTQLRRAMRRPAATAMSGAAAVSAVAGQGREPPGIADKCSCAAPSQIGGPARIAQCQDLRLRPAVSGGENMDFVEPRLRMLSKLLPKISGSVEILVPGLAAHCAIQAKSDCGLSYSVSISATSASDGDAACRCPTSTSRPVCEQRRLRRGRLRLPPDRRWLVRESVFCPPSSTHVRMMAQCDRSSFRDRVRIQRQAQYRQAASAAQCRAEDRRRVAARSTSASLIRKRSQSGFVHGRQAPPPAAVSLRKRTYSPLTLFARCREALCRFGSPHRQLSGQPY